MTRTRRHTRPLSGLVAALLLGALLALAPIAAPPASAAPGDITTIAGGVGGPRPAINTAQQPTGLAASGTTLYVATNNVVRSIDLTSGIESAYAGIGASGFAGDGGPAVTARLSGVSSLALDAAGNVYVADSGNNRVRKIDTGGTITTVAGNGSATTSGDGGAATNAGMYPTHLAVGNTGDLFIVDGSRVRRVSGGTITTVAGTGTNGYSGDGGPAVAAQLNQPSGLAVVSSGDVLVADRGNNRIRQFLPGGAISSVTSGMSVVGVAVDPADNTYYTLASNQVGRIIVGVPVIIAGTPVAGFAGDGGPATSAQLNEPTDLAIPVGGTAYVADKGNNRVRSIAAGMIDTIAGNGTANSAGDGDAAINAQISMGTRNTVAVAPDGTVYISDYDDNTIRSFKAGGNIETIQTVTTMGAPGYHPGSLATDALGDVFMTDITSAGYAGVSRRSPDGTMTRLFGLSFGAVSALSADPAGNAYVTWGSLTSGALFKIAPNGDQTSLWSGCFCGTNWPRPGKVATDWAGHVYLSLTNTATGCLEVVTNTAAAADRCGGMYDNAGQHYTVGAGLISKQGPLGGASTMVGGTGIVGFDGDGGPATAAAIDPGSIGVDANRNVYLGDRSGGRVRMISATPLPPSVPATPFGVSASAQSAAATVSWSAPLWNGGSPISGYTVTASPGGAQCAWSAGPLSCTVPGLTNGTPYTFTVTATNATGTSAPSAASSPVIPGKPSPPLAVAAAPGILGSANVSWTAPSSDGGAPISTYTVVANPGGNTCTWSAGPLFCTVNGLAIGTSYTFRVVADNGILTSDPSAPSAALTAGDLPSPPPYVTAAATGNGATIWWGTPASNGGIPLNAYIVTASPGGYAWQFGTGAIQQTVALPPGSYTFTVAARNAVGVGPAVGSSPVVVGPTPGAPDAPSGVVGAPGNTQATVSWTAPISDGGSPIVGYTVTTIPTGQTCAWTSGPLSCTVAGLTNGTSYTFVVTATNSVDTGPASSQSAPVVIAKPGPPTNVTAAPGSQSATVSWVAPVHDGGAPIAGYTVTSTPGNKTCTWSSGPLSCNVTGLVNGNSYTFRVVADNGILTSAASSASAAVTPADVPSAPPYVGAVAVLNGATVSWGVPTSNGGLPLNAYIVTASPGPYAWQFGTGATQQTVALPPGTYTFTVAARNSMGVGPAAGPTNPVVITSSAVSPEPPTGATASAGNSSANVSWTAPASSGGSPITGYTVTASPGGRTCTWSSGPLSCTVTGLTNGTTYTFTVHATNAVGNSSESVASNPVIPATVPDAPTGVSATAANSSATVSWTAPSSDGGSPFTSYTVTSSPDAKTCTWSSGPLSCTVTGLTNGTTYTFTVHATNVVGDSSESVASDAVTPHTDPGYHPTVPTRVLDSRTVTGGWNTTKLGPGESRPLHLAGAGGVPASATAVVLNVTVTAGTAGSYLTAYPAGDPVPTAAALNFGAGQTISNLVTVKIGTNGDLALFNKNGSVHVIADLAGWFDDGHDPTGQDVSIVSPTRILDSRSATSPWGDSPLGAGETRTLHTDRASGDAVIVNVTATGGTAASFLTLAPAGSAVPTAANLLFGAGQTTSNLAIVQVGTNGDIVIYNQKGTVDVIIDQSGATHPTAVPVSRFHPTAPTRVLDSRNGTGGYTSAWAPNTARTVPTTGPVPADATAVIVNITATNPTAATYITAYATGTPPLAANLLIGPGQTKPTLAAVPLNPDGTFTLYNANGITHLIADIVGYITST